MRVLHISDLHVNAENEAESRLLVEAMLKDAEAEAGEGGYDLAVFSGDLVARGKEEEFTLAERLLLAPLRERLNVPIERVLLCPGNHDVDRGEIRAMVEFGLASLGNAEEVDRLVGNEVELREATARLSSWGAFLQSSGAVGVGTSEDPLTRIWRLEVDGRSVGVLALNSAWRCSGAEDEGRLLTAGAQAIDALRTLGDCAVRLVVVHHPLDWLAPFEADRLMVELESQGVVVLGGHEHSPRPSSRMSPRGAAIYLQAGCLYAHLEYPSSYYILEIDPDDRTLLVKVRRWSETTRRFDTDTDAAVGGEERFELPPGGSFTDLGHPRFSTVKRMIAEAAAELRVLPDDMSRGGARPKSVADILIAPRLLSVPFREAQAMANLADGVGKQEIDAVGESIEKNVLVLSGEAQSGVSSALFWVLSEGYERDATKMPAYARLAESRVGTARESATLSKAAARFGHRSEDARDPDLAFAVDDVDPAVGKRFDRILSFIAGNPRHRFLLGCKAEDAAAVAARLQAAGIGHGTAHLAPFGKSQLRELATTVNHRGDADIDQIYGLIRTQSLPQTPFTMLALIAVVNVELTDPEEINQSSLLEAYVNLLLGSGEIAEAEKLGMNYRKRVALLGELARRLYDEPGWSLPLLDVERMFLEFFEARALRISASGVLNSLIARQVLSSDGERVGFGHPALLQLFLGKWMLEAEENKQEMLADPLANAQAIGHAVALERSDRGLLEQVGDFARKFIAEVAERLPREDVDKALERFDGFDTWADDRLDKTLERMPERRSNKELDEELDRWSEALDFGLEKFGQPALSTARELERATILLSDVLRDSDLVDDPALKQELFELAAEGWILLIGLGTVEDREVAPVRAMMEEIIEQLLDDPSEELQEVMSEIMLFLTTVVIAFVAQGKLGARSLASTIESCLDNSRFTTSMTGTSLSVWIEAMLGLPEWPQRLDALLERLPRGTFLRNATVSIAIAHYRVDEDEQASARLLDRLAPHLVATKEARSRNAEIARVKESLRKSRRVYQGGLLGPASAPTALGLSAGKD